jgi:hypothetical protein
MLASLVLAACGGVPDNGDEKNSGGTEMNVRDNRFVGVTYSAWFPPLTGAKWGTPVLGVYNSSDETVIERHAEWLRDAGVDFIVVDWTNNIEHVYGVQDNNLYYIEAATEKIYEVFARVENAPKIVIASGIDSASKAAMFANGTMQRRADEMWEHFYGNPKYEKLNFNFKGQPLLMMYLATPAVTSKDGKQIFDDPRYTERFFTGFLGQQPNQIRSGTRISKNGFWSWWERGDNVYAVNEDGSAECVTISAAWVGELPAGGDPNKPNDAWLPENGGVGRRNGDTFREQWDKAIALDPEIVLVQSFNEWTCDWLVGKASEELDAEYSNDIEPSLEHGYLYMNILKEKGYLYKRGK